MSRQRVDAPEEELEPIVRGEGLEDGSVMHNDVVDADAAVEAKVLQTTWSIVSVF